MSEYLPYLYLLGIGLLAGWIASLLLGEKGGLIRKLIIGLLGSVIGGILVPKLGLSLTDNVHLNNIITATAGACLLLLAAQFIAKD